MQSEVCQRVFVIFLSQMEAEIVIKFCDHKKHSLWVCSPIFVAQTAAFLQFSNPVGCLSCGYACVMGQIL